MRCGHIPSHLSCQERRWVQRYGIIRRVSPIPSTNHPCLPAVPNRDKLGAFLLCYTLVINSDCQIRPAAWVCIFRTRTIEITGSCGIKDRHRLSGRRSFIRPRPRARRGKLEEKSKGSAVLISIWRRCLKSIRPISVSGIMMAPSSIPTLRLLTAHQPCW